MSDLLKVRIGGSDYLCKWDPNFVVIGGRKYKTVKIGNQIWLAENLDWKFTGLNYKDGTSSNTLDNTSTPQAAYYNYDEATFGITGKNFGLMYNWYAVDYLNNHLSDLGVPAGWHVPTAYEFDDMVTACGSNPAMKLKATTEWASGAGTDDYGFAALPTGFWGTTAYTFGNIYQYGDFWTATEYSATDAWDKSIGSGSSVDSHTYEKFDCFSLRLVKAIA